MAGRFGDSARIDYYDATNPEVQTAHAGVLAEIEARGLMPPVTVIDGAPVYDGAVSYPAILRAVQNRLAERVAQPDSA